MRKKIGLLLVIIIIFSLFTNILVSYIYANSLPTFAVVDVVDKNADNINSEDSVQTVSEANFNFQSKSQILMEASTGQVIYENNCDEQLLPASVTKVMTILLIMDAIDSEKISYDDKVTCSEHASGMGGSQIWFKVGEQLTVDEALKCICVVSANDVSVAMAEMIGGNEENFVKMMNDRARKLGMLNTNFMNSHGIDEDNHYTSARDIAIMSKELITKHPDILKYTSIWMDSIRGGTFNLSNTNKLIRYYEGATGLKTGSTSKALFNLSATATKNDMTLIAVVMTAPSGDVRNEETKQLLNYGFTNYQVQKISEKDQTIDEIKVNKYLNGNVKMILKDGFSLLNEKGKDIQYSTNVNINENITAPINKGDVVGIVEYLDSDGKTIGSVEIITEKEVPKSGVLDYILFSLKTYAMM